MLSSKDELPRIERLSKLTRGICVDTADTHQSLKGIGSEPLFVTLRFEAGGQVLDFAVTSFLIEIHVKIRVTKIAVIFENFIFEDQLIAPGVPGQLVDHSMILMEIIASVREDQIGRQRVFQLFKVLFDFDVLRRKKSIAEVQDRDILLSGTFQKEFGAMAGFFVAGGAGTENYPVEFQVATCAQKFEDGTAAANLDVVGMGSQT